MTPPQRDELGVITRDPTPTPIPVPDKGPECTAKTDIDVQGIVEFLYLKAKPKGVELIEMAWGYADGQDVSAESLPYRETFSHNPLRLHFREEDRGKKVCFMMRYCTREGNSPWSVAKTVMVP
jgi:hypothetical protein